MAKSAAHLARYQFQPRAAAPVVVYKTRTVHAKPKHKGHRGHGRASSEKVLMGMAMGGFALGFIDKSGTAIPTIPLLGRAGTIALAAHFIGKGKPGILTDVRNAAAAVAAYEMGSTGKIAGDEPGGMV